MADANTSLGAVVSDDTLPPGAPWSGIVEAGGHLTIVDLEGHQGVDFLCYNADDFGERYNAPTR